MNEFYGLSSLKGLLADTLREKPCGYVIEEIFARFPSVPELLDATEQELTGIKGVGKAKARQIVSNWLKEAPNVPEPLHSGDILTYRLPFL
ncbi:hypothetical protein PAESOLCIP111_05923 [Paenibacillus solanacearum]|uniref:Uncharacterized protein n=1 Tax=Paenibacillus solanacearum TaxID=2048548 RepID=A0A916NLE9_9BACL|nr:hypothetical protein [Paenibacillus solanacearum]CAG7649682.1 hypothetical protein PAESOLCIP111_05923 [Paenibacillus solanacearum]